MTTQLGSLETPYGFASESCNNGDGALIADVNDIIKPISFLIELSSFVSIAGMSLTAVGILTVLCCCNKDKRKTVIESFRYPL